GIRCFHVTGVQTCALPIYAVDVLRPPGDLGANLRPGELGFDLSDHRGNVPLAIDALLSEPTCDTLVVLRLEVPKSKVLELPFEQIERASCRERVHVRDGVV